MITNIYNPRRTSVATAGDIVVPRGRNRADLLKAAGLLAVGALLVILMVGWLGGEGVFEKISTLNPLYFLLAVAVQLSYAVLWGLRWALIIRAQGQTIPRDVFAITFSGAFFNNITPVSKTGGEPLRGYLMGKVTDTSFEEGMASVVVDRIFDMAPFILICLGTFALVVFLGLAENMLLMALILLGLATACLFSAFFIAAALRKETGYRIVMFFLDKLEFLIKRWRPIDELREKSREALERFYLGISNIAGNRRLLVVSLLISLLLWLMVILRLKLVFMSIGGEASLAIINVVAVASVFAGFAPFLPGGLGVTEFVMIGLFIGLGSPEDVAGSVVFVDRIVSFWLMTLAGGLATIYLGLKLQVGWRTAES